MHVCGVRRPGLRSQIKHPISELLFMLRQWENTKVYLVFSEKKKIVVNKVPTVCSAS